MTSMPASRSARAMIFAPRSWPSRPGLATTTRIFRAVAAVIGWSLVAVPYQLAVELAQLAADLAAVGDRIVGVAERPPIESGGVRPGRRRRGVEAVPVVPEDRVEAALRQPVGLIQRQALRGPAVGGGVRVDRGHIHVRDDRVVGSGVGRRAREGVIH